MRGRSRALMVALAASTMAAAACAAPKKRPPTYRVDQTFHPRTHAPERMVGAQARAVMAGATTIAFVPPDTCHTILAVTEQTVEEAPEEDGLGCASLMSRLEAGAISHGFEVVSWQSLHGPQRPIDYAQQLGVDVLFEVNEAGFGVPAAELYASAETRVFDGATGQAVAVANPVLVAQRCIPGFEPALDAGATVVLDVKMVSVADGKVHWAYRAVNSPLQAGAPPTFVERYDSSTTSYRPKGRAGWKIGVGAPALALSLVSALVSIVFDVAGESDIPGTLYLAEALLLGTGIYMMSTIDADAYWEYEPVDEVVCVPSKLTTTRAETDDDRCGASCEARKARFDQATRALMAELLALKH